MMVSKRFKISVYILLFISLVLFFWYAFGSKKEIKNNNLILTTVVPVNVVVGQVVGDSSFDVKLLTSDYLDSHCCLDHFSLSPRDIADLETASLLILSGASLEKSLNSQLDHYKNLVLLNSSDGIEIMKDEHGHENPWIWLSVPNYIKQVNNICSGLSKSFPSERNKFEINSRNYLKNLTEMFDGWKHKFEKFSGKKVLTLSNEFDYLLNSLGLVPVHLIDEHHHDGSLSISDLNSMKNIIETGGYKFYLISSDSMIKYLDLINDSTGAKYVKLSIIKSQEKSYVDEMNKNFESLMLCCEEFL